MREHILLFAALVLTACPPPISTPDAATTIEDAGISSSDAGTSDAGTRGPFDAGTDPGAPTPGELTFWQLDLPPGPLARTGEAGILIGTDGTLVLIDVGNSNHDDEILAAVSELNTQLLTPGRGYRQRAEFEVEYVLLTHFHADHIGSFDALASQLNITRGVVHRGFVDVGPGTNETDFSAMCTQLTGTLAAKNLALCTGSPSSPCTISGRAPATSCAGLTRGELFDVTDDASGDPSFIDLGNGARLELLGANGFMLQGRTPVASAAFGVTDVNEENARSLVMLVRHGAFRFLLAGDLSGSGQPTEPDLESFVVNSAPDVFANGGIDVTHANHHARKTSSNANWVNATAPSDGKTRNVLAGINAAYVNSPHQETLDAWTNGARLGPGGRLVVTHRAPLGGTGTALLDVNGRATLQTVERGGGYWLAGSAYESVRR
ncbi:MAG: MBL fold metallo-hydrolase [Archangium sp.]|nr:MBL fold metallo-hydrolase [Archangium sp.]